MSGLGSASGGGGGVEGGAWLFGVHRRFTRDFDGFVLGFTGVCVDGQRMIAMD